MRPLPNPSTGTKLLVVEAKLSDSSRHDELTREMRAVAIGALASRASRAARCGASIP